MSTGREVLAYLSLDDREPQRSGERLIEWAAACRADGVIIPWIPGITDCLVERVRHTSLHCYVAPRPGQAPKSPGIDGYYIDTPQEWSPAMLQDCGRLLIRIENKDEWEERLKNGHHYTLSGARFLYVHRDGALKTWLELCQCMQKSGSKLPGYFDENPGIGHALESVAYAPLIIKRLALNRSMAGDHGALMPYDLGELIRTARGIQEQLAVIAGERPAAPESASGVPERGAAGIAIVIRSKNEAEWIGRTLEAIVRQRRQPKEVVLVDNESTDDTVGIARCFQGPLNLKVVSISESEFNFSRALNRGIEQTTAPWVISLSAHCIPTTEHWLEEFERETLDAASPFFAGVYGRQEPLEGVTSDFDKRDLWTTFGAERQVQNENFLFHNANSMIRRSAWERFRFNENIHGVEDRDWAQSVLRDGYTIVYTPHASVYHHHGIHHGRNEERAKRVARVIELIQQREAAEAPLR